MRFWEVLGVSLFVACFTWAAAFGADNDLSKKLAEKSEGQATKSLTAPVSAKNSIGGLPGTCTTLSITNSSGLKQYFYLSLTPISGTYPASEQITQISQVNLTGNFAKGEGVITQYGDNPLEGYFFLNKGTTANFAPGMTVSGRLFVNGTRGDNDSQCYSGVFPNHGTNGATYVEFTLNVDSTYGVTEETVDISEVNGVNSLWSVSLPLPAGNLSQPPPAGSYPWFFSTAGYLFPTQTTVPTWGTFAQGQLVPVATIANNPGASPVYSGDANAQLPYGIGKGTVGVYPNGCDQCTSRVKPGCSQASYPPASKVQQSLTICQVQRYYAYQIGGNVGITLKQFPFPAIEFKPNQHK